MTRYTVTVDSMDGLQLKTAIEAQSDARAGVIAHELRERARFLTADDLLQLDYEPADPDAAWVNERPPLRRAS